MEEKYIIKSYNGIFKRYYIAIPSLKPDMMSSYNKIMAIFSYRFSHHIDDLLIAAFCGLTFREYRKILKIRFNGSFNKKDNIILYKNKDDAEKALTWIENRIDSQAMMKKLTEN